MENIKQKDITENVSENITKQPIAQAPRKATSLKVHTEIEELRAELKAMQDPDIPIDEERFIEINNRIEELERKY